MAKKYVISSAVSVLFILGLVLGATAGIPDTNNSTAWTDFCGRHTMAPCGGEALKDLTIPQDYTIHAIVMDVNGAPVTTLAATDMSLYHANMATCAVPYSQADQGTDATGYTLWSINPGLVHAGLMGDATDGINCNTDTFYEVYALGIILNMGNPVCIASDSPDLDGSLSVAVADFAKYAVDYNCVPPNCDPCHDYNESGSNNIADFAIFAGYFNNCFCP